MSRCARAIVIDLLFFFFFFNDTATTEIYTLSLHDALPIWARRFAASPRRTRRWSSAGISKPASSSSPGRSEEHTSELQSPCNLVCRLLLEKKKQVIIHHDSSPICSLNQTPYR